MGKTDFGLTERDLNTIFSILRKYEAISLVHVFGSRALGTHKPGSDIDLAIMNDGVPDKTFVQLQGDFSESSLPYRVDLVDFTRLTHKEFTDHIQRVGLVFYRKGE